MVAISLTMHIQPSSLELIAIPIFERRHTVAYIVDEIKRKNDKIIIVMYPINYFESKV